MCGLEPLVDLLGGERDHDGASEWVELRVGHQEEVGNDLTGLGSACVECVAHQFAGLAQGFAGEEELRKLRRLRELWITLFTLQLIEVLAERLGDHIGNSDGAERFGYRGDEVDVFVCVCRGFLRGYLEADLP